jgi:dTDP-4-dehydrorhamnose reductase
MVLYGFAEGVRPNFALWLLDSLQRGTSVTVVDDQMGNPTLVDDLAFGLMKAVELGKTGIYNIAGRDVVSRYEFAVKLARVFGLDEQLVRPAKTEQLRQAAPRPLKSGLVTLKAQVELGFSPAGVEDGLAVLQSQLARSGRWMADRVPAPGKAAARPTTSRQR